MIQFSDFEKLELKVGLIQEVKDHPNADKLYVLIVDFNEDEDRLVVAGIKEYYKKEELEGKKAIFITNLETAKIRGVESEAMILAASDKDKKTVSILEPEKDLPEGSKIS